MNALSKLALLFCIALLSGCANATRLSVEPEEKTHRFSIQHSQPQKQAFSAVELALAEIYNDLPSVLKLKQSESGVFLLKPLAEYRIADLGAGFHGSEHARYTLKITVQEKFIALDFELGPNEGSGTWAPKTEIPKLRAGFQEIAAKVAKGVNGSLSAN